MRYAFFGDLKLPTEMKAIIPQWPRAVTQTFSGVDRLHGLVVGNSPNITCILEVTCFWAPESDFSKKAFRAHELAVAEALVARSETLYPVAWIEDSSRSKTVTSYSAPTITSTSHGFSNGDRVLIRRNGKDLFTLGTVAGVTTHTFTVSAAHAIQTGDEIHLVEKFWGSMLAQPMSPIRPAEAGDFYAEEVSFNFVGSGLTTYSRTSVSLG